MKGVEENVMSCDKLSEISLTKYRSNLMILLKSSPDSPATNFMKARGR